MKEGVGSVVKGGLKLGSKLLKKSAPFMGGATVGGTIGYETGKEKEREKTDAMMRSAYQDQGMLLQTNSDLRKQIKDTAPDIELSQEIDIEGESVKVNVPMTVGFFWPDTEG